MRRLRPHGRYNHYLCAWNAGLIASRVQKREDPTCVRVRVVDLLIPSHPCLETYPKRSKHICSTQIGTKGRAKALLLGASMCHVATWTLWLSSLGLHLCAGSGEIVLVARILTQRPLQHPDEETEILRFVEFVEVLIRFWVATI